MPHRNPYSHPARAVQLSILNRTYVIVSKLLNDCTQSFYFPSFMINKVVCPEADIMEHDALAVLVAFLADAVISQHRSVNKIVDSFQTTFQMRFLEIHLKYIDSHFIGC